LGVSITTTNLCYHDECPDYPQPLVSACFLFISGDGRRNLQELFANRASRKVHNLQELFFFGGGANFAGTLPELFGQNLLNFARTLQELCRNFSSIFFDKQSLS
jgi:hypothetical protein